MKNNLLLQAKNLKKSFSEQIVVNDFTLEVHKQQVVGLLGPNGAGKTTAFYMLIGLIQPDAGEIFFCNTNICDMPIHLRANMGIGYLAQEPSVFRTLTVEENIVSILETLDLTQKEQKQELEKFLHELNLEHLRKNIACSLSGGERRRLEITRALIRKPKLLLLDEPFANIDPITIQEVKKLIQLLKKNGISILITDHNAREIFSIVDTSYLMIDGKILTSGNMQKILDSETAKKHYLGEEFQY